VRQHGLPHRNSWFVTGYKWKEEFARKKGKKTRELAEQSDFVKLLRKGKWKKNGGKTFGDLLLYLRFGKTGEGKKVCRGEEKEGVIPDTQEGNIISPKPGVETGKAEHVSGGGTLTHT